MLRKKHDQGLSQARALYREKNFTQVITLLSPQIFLYRTNAEFYSILGSSCLYTNDFGGAHTYLSRAIDLDPQEIRAKTGLAVVQLKRGKYTEALQLWLDVLSVDPNNSQAAYGLNYVRNIQEPENVPVELSSRLKKELYPPTGFPLKPIKMLSIVMATILILGAFMYFLYQWVTAPENITREGGELLLIGSDIPRLAPGGMAQVILTTSQINELLRSSARAFDGFLDNRVRYYTNQILLSNASEDIKAQMRLLTDLLRVPSFVDSQWYPTVREVIDKPDFYHSVFIRWSGQVSNLQVQSDSVTFDLLVGYQTQAVLEAIVPVRVNFAVELRPGENIEIIGQLTSRDGMPFFIQASSIRYIR